MDKTSKNSSFIKLGFSSKVAMMGLIHNPLRTALTVLGVTIGVASVISLMGIGEGARVAVMDQFESLGTNVIKVAVHDKAYEFEPEYADELATRVQGVNFASPVVNVETQMKWKRDRTDVHVLGTNEQLRYIRDYEIVDGHFISEYHVKLRSNVAVVGYNVAHTLMYGRSPVGRYISLNGESYEIIGVIGEKGLGKSDGIDDKIIIPYTCAQKISQKRTIEEIWCKANSTAEANLATVQLGRIIKNKYHLNTDGSPSGNTPSPGGGGGGGSVMMMDGMYYERMMYDGYSDSGNNQQSSGEEIITITNLNQMVEEADEANKIMSLLLGGIAAVSLLVGGLGIMNIMLVAVSERTVEIGLRRALGAQKTDLLAQFLLEALFVSVIGSCTGILLGMGGVLAFKSFGFDAAVSIKSIFIATGVSLSCGIIFGVYPALSASSIPPVIALRRQ